MNQKFQQGQRVIVTGSNGIPDRPGIVRSHIQTSVWVEFDDRKQGGNWFWEAHVRPQEETFVVPALPSAPLYQTNLFD